MENHPGFERATRLGHPGAMSQWFDDDAFWAAVQPALFPPSRYEAAPEEIDAIVALADLDPGAAVLDLACGPGRHALELARRGFRVTGVDRTRFYLDQARAASEAERLDVELLEADMRLFERPDAFDLVVNLFTSFGFFEDPDDDLTVARHACEALRPGGAFVIDVMSKEILARRWRPRDWSEVGDMLLLQDRSVNLDWSWITNRWIVVRGGERLEFAVEHRLYSAVELRRLLLDAGFPDVDCYGGFDGRPYGLDADRLVVVGRAG